VIESMKLEVVPPLFGCVGRRQPPFVFAQDT
jgi:hypothetical protein